MSITQIHHIISGEGEISSDPLNLQINNEYVTISIIGVQSSGKSTLINDMFDTQLQTLSDQQAGKQTTKGVQLIDVQSKYIILDCEGADSKERLLNQSNSQFESQIGAMVCAISDVIVINLWYTDIGRYKASNYDIMKVLFYQYFKVLRAQRQSEKIKLVFTVRDSRISCEEQAQEIKQQLFDDIKTIYKQINDELSHNVDLETCFEIDCFFFHHRKFERQEYDNDVINFKKILLRNVITQQISADLLIDFYRNVWAIIKSNDSLNIIQQREYLQRIKADKLADDLIDVITNHFKDFSHFQSYEEHAGSNQSIGSMSLKSFRQQLAMDQFQSYFSDDNITVLINSLQEATGWFENDTHSFVNQARHTAELRVKLCLTEKSQQLVASYVQNYVENVVIKSMNQFCNAAVAEARAFVLSRREPLFQQQNLTFIWFSWFARLINQQICYFNQQENTLFSFIGNLFTGVRSSEINADVSKTTFKSSQMLLQALILQNLVQNLQSIERFSDYEQIDSGSFSTVLLVVAEGLFASAALMVQQFGVDLVNQDKIAMNLSLNYHGKQMTIIEYFVDLKDQLNAQVKEAANQVVEGVNQYYMNSFKDQVTSQVEKLLNTQAPDVFTLLSKVHDQQKTAIFAQYQRFLLASFGFEEAENVTQLELLLSQWKVGQQTIDDNTLAAPFLSNLKVMKQIPLTSSYNSQFSVNSTFVSALESPALLAERTKFNLSFPIEKSVITQFAADLSGEFRTLAEKQLQGFVSSRAGSVCSQKLLENIQVEIQKSGQRAQRALKEIVSAQLSNQLLYLKSLEAGTLLIDGDSSEFHIQGIEIAIETVQQAGSKYLEEHAKVPDEGVSTRDLLIPVLLFMARKEIIGFVKSPLAMTFAAVVLVGLLITHRSGRDIFELGHESLTSIKALLGLAKRGQVEEVIELCKKFAEFALKWAKIN